VVAQLEAPDCSVRLTYGAHFLNESIAGLSVAEASLAYIDILNLPPKSEGYLNGKFVQDWHTRLTCGDHLVFVPAFGRKGAGSGGELRKSERTLSSAIRQATIIGEQVKALQLDQEKAVDETVRRMTTLLEDILEVDPLSEMLTIKQAAELIGCSYGEARNRILDGRIKAVRDGRWYRTRREWVEEYIANRLVQKPNLQPAEIKQRRLKAKQTGNFKKGGLAYEFLRSRPD
jgi:excisionase family DNA binding protein